MKTIQGEYPAIRREIDRVKAAYPAGSRIPEIFENCIANTLKTTIHPEPDGTMFVITGDIPAMWLRDSACQLHPFLRFAGKEPEIKEILDGLIARQAACILIDPYANAFNEEANGNCYNQDETDMKPELWERKFEIDSLCYPMQLAYLYWKETGFTDHFTEGFLEAARTVVHTFRTEQYHESRSPYYFRRPWGPYTETLSREGKGALVKEGIGLIWSGFRPSDDACTYGYLIPSNMFASVVLGQLSEIAREIYGDAALAEEWQAFSEEVREAIEKYAVMPGLPEKVYAYEVDGHGQYLFMDDANLPSLLSMPYFGYCAPDDAGYLSTRAKVLSDMNPYYYEGKCLKGVGSPHTPVRYVWDIALGMQGLTSPDPAEKRRLLELMAACDAGTGLMHEGIDVDDPTQYTRPWFSWANSVFCELVMQEMEMRKG